MNNLIFDETCATPLCEIMGRYKSDKGHKNIETCKHNYTTLYYNLFQQLQKLPIRVFELGLGTNNVNLPSNMGAMGVPGASLYGWAEFFSEAKIFGADIDTQILFQTDRIKTFYCDQTKPEIIASMWQTPALRENFDIIIEDGLHTFKANVCFFENSAHKLAKGGYFIIEDVLTCEIPLFIEKINDWKKKYPTYFFRIIQIPSLNNQVDNNVILIQRM